LVISKTCWLIFGTASSPIALAYWVGCQQEHGINWTSHWPILPAHTAGNSFASGHCKNDGVKWQTQNLDIPIVYFSTFSEHRQQTQNLDIPIVCFSTFLEHRQPCFKYTHFFV